MSFFTKGEIAAKLGVSTITVDRLRRRGLLPYRRIGGTVRFTENDLNTFIERTAVDGAENAKDMAVYARGGRS
jgi:excisionase family DNA binding protein